MIRRRGLPAARIGCQIRLGLSDPNGARYQAAPHPSEGRLEAPLTLPVHVAQSRHTSPATLSSSNEGEPVNVVTLIGNLATTSS